jgi:hypothetical protein
MTNYTIAKGNDVVDPNKEVWFVTFADGPQVGLRQSLTGYKNEESAKRRIRDLKRKEAETLCKDEGCPQSATDHVCIDKPPVEKIAAASEYGRVHHDIANTNRIVSGQVGVYPHVSKHAYQR